MSNDRSVRYRQANPEAVKASAREASRRYRAAHPERVAEQRAAARERRAKASSERRAALAAATVADVDVDVLYAVFTVCYLCGDELNGSTHLDHIVPLARGGAHVLANLRPVHETCNLRKSNQLLAELGWYSGHTNLGVSL